MRRAIAIGAVAALVTTSVVQAPLLPTQAVFQADNSASGDPTRSVVGPADLLVAQANAPAPSALPPPPKNTDVPPTKPPVPVIGETTSSARSSPNARPAPPDAIPRAARVSPPPRRAIVLVNKTENIQNEF